MSVGDLTAGPILYGMQRSLPWCVIEGEALHPVLRCRRCGGWYPIHLPASPMMLRAVQRAFVEDHCGCLDGEESG